METRFLFPNRFKKIGWVLLIPSVIVGLFTFFTDYHFEFLDVNVFALYTESFMKPGGFFKIIENNIMDELAGIFLIVGAILVACSKEKNEDEFIARIRLESLLWAMYVNYFLLLLSILFVYDVGFYSIMVFNMFTLLLFFLIRFNFILYKTSKTDPNEK